MSYRKAEQILPIEVIELIQKYVDGEYIYIPRKSQSRRSWGEGTNIRNELQERNLKIYLDHQNGLTIEDLAGKYYLSENSIRRILYKMNEVA